MNPRPPGPQPGALTELSYGHHVPRTVPGLRTAGVECSVESLHNREPAWSFGFGILVAQPFHFEAAAHPRWAVDVAC